MIVSKSKCYGKLKTFVKEVPSIRSLSVERMLQLVINSSHSNSRKFGSVLPYYMSMRF